MTDPVTGTSRRTAAVVVGIAYLVMFVVAIFAEFFVRQGLVVAGDAAATAANLTANDTLFRAGIGGYLVILVSDVLMAWGLYVFLKPINKSLSLLAAWFRLVYTAVSAAALFNLAGALRLVNGAGYLSAFPSEQLQAQALMLLETFADGWAAALVFFALHLFFLGYLVLKLGLIPRIVGVVCLISSFTYLADNVGKLLLVNYEAYSAIAGIFAMLSFLGEFLLVLWIVVTGLKERQAP